LNGPEAMTPAPAVVGKSSNAVMVSEKIDRKRGIRNRERTWLNHGPCLCMFLKKTKWAKWRAEKIKFKFIQLNVGRLLKSADLRYQPMYPRGIKNGRK